MPSRPNFKSRILVETSKIVAWNKPAGLLTTGRTLDDPDCAQHLAMQHFDQMVWALHQLDRDTSGVVLFALSKSTVATWQKTWKSEAIRKFYIALVHGRLPAQSMLIDAPLLRENRRGYTMVSVDESGKPATTEVRELSHADQYSMVLASPITGRTHQIRAHLQHVGCPLVGEQRYNSIPCGYHHRQALHALAIITDRPGPLDRIEAPFPDDLCQAAEKLNIDIEPLARWNHSI